MMIDISYMKSCRLSQLYRLWEFTSCTEYKDKIINNERLSKFSITITLQEFIHIHSQIFSPKVNFLLSKKLLIDATETANINDIAY